jgi:pyruvate formate lyase activating enzyme
MDVMARAEMAGRDAGLNYVYLGNVLTTDGQNTRCPDCGAVLVERSGFSRPVVRVKEPRCRGCGRMVPLILT